ncbi:MAG TPA: ATP-binding cassette domain-containing protein [Thermoplasmata archaeon]|nr:ATP-binding cassette domain-containing protein [Thermoplasmata archaeon]
MSLLEVSGVTHSFGGNRALDAVSFKMSVDALAIVGPNGAGKTTLLNVIAGSVHPDRGLIQFQGRDVTRLPPWRIARLGMVKTYQVVRPFRSLTVEENLRLFAELRGKADVDQILQETGLTEWRDYPSGVLPFGLLKRLELAKGLATRPELLLLDEPISGLSRAEAQGLIATLATLKASGTRMVLVEHRLSEILPLVDRVVALDRGRLVFDGTRPDFFRDPAVRSAYLGSDDASG